MSVACERCAMSGKGLWDGLITHPEELDVSQRDRETATEGRL